MKNFVIWSVVLLAMAATACNKAPKPAGPGKAPQKSGAGGKTKGAPQELAVDMGGGVKMEMVLVPAGEFTMGDDKLGADWVKPVHRVKITKPFWLGKYEVTQEQWEAVMGDNPGYLKVPECPVTQVSWDDCQMFFDILNAETGGQGDKFVLPTDAQWEYACRAGSASKFCFGDDEDQLGEYAWYDKNSGNKPHPVGQKKPNAFGLYDMHGNASEWCADWFGSDYYAFSPTDDPKGPATGSRRVFRGASWGNQAFLCRSAVRAYHEPGGRNVILGLRASRVAADK